jgi:hypothetical protein
MARKALDEFNKSGQAVVTLDLDRMFEFLAPRRVRWAGVAIPLMPHANRTTTEGRNMTDVKAFDTHLSYIERHVAELDKRTAAKKEIPASLIQSFRQATITLPDFGDQSKNKAWYGLGEPKVDTVEDPGAYTPPPAVTHPLGKSASVRNLTANAEMAETILTQVAETSEKVDALEAAGRPFNAAKAREDLHKIACNCEAILQDADLAEPYVANDLGQIAKQAAHIHGLFASARV